MLNSEVPKVLCQGLASTAFLIYEQTRTGTARKPCTGQSGRGPQRHAVEGIQTLKKQATRAAARAVERPLRERVVPVTRRPQQRQRGPTDEARS